MTEARQRIIEVTDLVRYFGRGESAIKAVAGISFHVDRGEVFGFLGPNGAGKSTTIKMLITLLKPTGGSATVAGFDLVKDPKAIRDVIGYTSQAATVDDDLTGRENLMLMTRLYHLPRSERKSRVAELIGIMQLEDAADRPAYTYSGGMRRRLDLAMGLVHRPQLLFLDEPTTGLDPQTRNAVWDHLRALQQEGTTIFLTTQYMEEADQLCTRLAIIDRGVIVAEGTPSALKAEVGEDQVILKLPKDSDFEVNQVRAIEVLQDLEGAHDPEGSADGVRFAASDAASILVAAMRAMDSAGVPINSVVMRQPTLDAVFLKHTGKEMRVEEAQARKSHWRTRRK